MHTMHALASYLNESRSYDDARMGTCEATADRMNQGVVLGMGSTCSARLLAAS